jgi:uncharacterized protein with HEPN domain
MWRDDANVLDMLIAARRANEFTMGLTWERFRDSSLHQHAIAKALENIGEAAGKVSEEYREGHQEIAWRKITGLRHRIAHDYFRLDILRVWEIATMDVPALITVLEPLVPPEEDV